jgi:hypothetical protein
MSKRIVQLTAVGLAVASAWPLGAQAYPYIVTGTINYVRIADSSIGVNQDSITLVGISSLGGCLSWQGSIIFRIKDDAKGQRQIATALAAKAAGSTVVVQVDDTIVDSSGSCYALTLQEQ